MAERPETLTGVLKISAGEPAIALKLTFEKTTDGDEWSEDRILEAIRQRGIREEIPREKLTAFLRNASAAQEGPVTVKILEGHKPVPPAPDTVVWEEMPVPEKLACGVDRILEEAPPPEIYRNYTETVERQKEIVRKSGLPFVKDKTEVKVFKEAVERREKVIVDPSVHAVHYARAETMIGRITPRSEGLPGRDIYGRAIPVRKLADPVFHAGTNVQKKGDELYATAEGFVRVGRNWVDVVPFAPHQWSVELSPDRATCFLVLTPGHHLCTPPDPEAILAAAEELSYSRDSLLGADEVAALLQSRIEEGTADRVSISSSRDASYDIFVTDDKQEAYLNVHKGKGRGKPLNLREIGAAIKQSGLRKLNFDQIKTDILAFYESNEMDLTSYLLCEGTAPVPGPERLAEYSITFDKESKTEELRENLKKLLADERYREDESVHMESLQEFPPDSIQKTAEVKPEQLLCTIDPPAPGEPGQDVYGMTIPAEAGAAPEIRLFENVKQRDLVILTTAAGVLDYRDDEGVVSLRVRPHKNAVITVSVSDSKMEAYLSLEEGAGSGTRLTREAIDEALASAHVARGVDSEIIEKGLLAARAGTPVSNLTVARGLPPVDQSENQVEFLVDTDNSASVRIRKDGTADYRNQGKIVTVAAGEEICRILPSRQEAVDGVDVLGNAVQARKITGVPLEIGENLLREEQDDGTIVIKAEIEGELQYSNKRLELLSTHTVKGDVDMSVGNIRFPGTVLIGGTVRTGFYVISAGDIKIAGGVEGALISSDGDIYIKEGVKGAGKAVLRSKQNIFSPFVELATVLAVGDLVLKSALVRSRIKCNGEIAFKGDKGRIVGGTIRARNGFEVNVVGSERGVKTQLSFGQDYLIADLIEKEEQEIDKVKRRITQVDMEMRKSEKAGDGKSLESLRAEKVKLLKLMEKRGLRLFTLRERFEQHFPSRVVVHNEVHVGTVFESHGRTVEITRPRKAIAVEFNPHTGNIDLSDLNGE